MVRRLDCVAQIKIQEVKAMEITVIVDCVASWVILGCGTLLGGLWLIFKGLEQREHYRRENEDFFKNK